MHRSIQSLQSVWKESQQGKRKGKEIFGLSYPGTAVNRLTQMSPSNSAAIILLHYCQPCHAFIATDSKKEPASLMLYARFLYGVTDWLTISRSLQFEQVRDESPRWGWQLDRSANDKLLQRPCVLLYDVAPPSFNPAGSITSHTNINTETSLGSSFDFLIWQVRLKKQTYLPYRDIVQYHTRY